MSRLSLSELPWYLCHSLQHEWHSVTLRHYHRQLHDSSLDHGPHSTGKPVVQSSAAGAAVASHCTQGGAQSTTADSILVIAKGATLFSWIFNFCSRAFKTWAKKWTKLDQQTNVNLDKFGRKHPRFCKNSFIRELAISITSEVGQMSMECFDMHFDVLNLNNCQTAYFTHCNYTLITMQKQSVQGTFRKIYLTPPVYSGRAFQLLQF